MSRARPRGLKSAARSAALRRALLAWYRRSARDLAWRQAKDPYRVWLSEILLQQTRVQTVRPYYDRFVAAFPSVRALAAAPLERVLKVWEGLGYYSRARNLHRAARMIEAEHGGRLPQTAAQWQQLPGIGRYTAGAIASIACGERVAAVDGNVKRVLARLFHVEKPLEDAATQAVLWQLATELLPRSSPGEFNQALMELGARVCTPRSPRCDACPVRRWCRACAAGVQQRLPIRRARKAVPRVEAVAAVMCERGRCLLVRRPPRGLLGGLWTLPGAEIGDGQPHAQTLRCGVQAALGLDIEVGERLASVRHEFSHRRLQVHVYRCRVIGGAVNSPEGAARWVPRARLERYPMASLDRKLLREAVR
jgi:A/G-specific adenine glycosylase